MNITINRTHGNTQYFHHLYSESMNYLTVFESSFYVHRSNDSNAIMELFNYDAYENFVKNANTTMLYRLKNWKIGAGYFKQIAIDGKSKITHYEGLNATKRIFGIGIEYSDLTLSELVLQTTLDNNVLLPKNDVKTC